jgi:uncharacterized protein
MNKIIFKYRYLIFVFILLQSFLGFSQDGIPAKPKLQTSVYDYARLLKPIEKQRLEEKLIKYNDTTSTQIVVATISSLKGKDIALFATEWAHKWGIGQKGKDNGVFLLVSKNDRKVTIRTGYGVEHKLTDAYSRRIIEQVIKPEFRKGNFYQGLDKATTYIIKALNGEYQGLPKSRKKSEGIPFGLIFFIIIVLLLIISSKNKGGNSRGNISRSILDTIILSNMGRSGGFGGGFGGSSGGGSFGGGGFGGGFGGGGFGGGGASGSW